MNPSDTTDGAAERDTARVQLARAAGAIVGTWFWDVTRDRVTVDEALADAFGLDPAAARDALPLGQIVAAVHPDDAPGLEAAIADAMRRGGRYAHEYRARGSDGRYRWLEAIGRVDLDADGRAVEFSGVLVDVDERRRLESERDQAQTLLRSFVDAAPGVVYAKDRQGRLLIGNRATTELIGRPPEAYIGRTDAELLGDAAQAAAVMATDARIMASGQGEQIEEAISLADGRQSWWLSTKAPLRDADGQVVGLVGTSLDITDRKAAEARHLEFEERYRLAARATNDAIWDWRIVDGQVVWNAALTTLFGHAVTETDAQWWLDHIHPDDRARIDAGIHAVIEGAGSVWTAEYRFRRADGSHAAVLDRGTVLRDEAGTPVRMIGAMLDLSASKAAEAALAESEERLRLATEAGDMGFWDVDLVHDVLIWSTRTRAMFGISSDTEVSLRDFYDGLHPEDRDATTAAFEAAADPARRALYDVEYRTIGKADGVVRWVAAKGRGLFDGGRCLRVVGVVIDVTARKHADARLQELNEQLESRVLAEVAERARVEDALRQSQKMEAVGQLTGGIAHDFNNMLATVIGPLDLLVSRLGDQVDPRAKRYIDMAIDGASRAAQLTQRLLAFARQQPLQPVAVDANRLVAGMSELLGHSLGASVRLETVLADDVWWVHVDANQLENVILNLAVNARDAMPGGGRLTIATGNARVDAGGRADVPPGDYVVITVSDSGSGMPPEVMARAFDPFYTTKGVGKGTGLGLSQVYGFVRQSAGHVTMRSDVGQGTVVTLYLPRHATDVEAATAAVAAAAPRRGRGELVLVVDDEPTVRQFCAEALTELGYRVLATDGAVGALALLEAHPAIALLFTDVVMPEVNGRQLADAALARRPDLKVLFATGNSRNTLVHDGVLEPGVQLIGKPFTLEALATRVSAVLAEAG
ncbi:PAS domain-containing protein [Luteimonas sp. WGS1318]|uniref:PAS domain-containing protein n=1 Tax=Luteimonas sp. WGS1318 TaxID=3366815 RepID=UPI00372D54A3